METIYRGYPQVLYQAQPMWAMEQPTPAPAQVQPYMLYRREDQRPQENVPDRRRLKRNETEYFKGLYPMNVRRRQVLVDEICDRLDYAGSSMYDEYPDRESMYRMRDAVCRRARELGMDEDRDMTQLLLVNEINRRRWINRD